MDKSALAVSGTTFFFYGTLCHAPLLTAVLGREVAMRPARLADHAVHWVADHAFPMILSRAGAEAAGVVVEGLDATDIERLDFYEGGFDYATHAVTAEADGTRIAARVYIASADRLRPGAPWRLADWVDRYGAVAVLAAGRFMQGFGTVPPGEAWRRYPAMLVTAASRLRAAVAAPTGLRRAAAAGDIDVMHHAEPYAQFFSVEEFDLRHRRFDGAMSGEMRRAVFMSGDAATVLPYDPVRDRVMLIEQFRAGPFGRGDPQPWMLEPIAGRIDPGETPEMAARREAVEEAGITLGVLLKAGEYYPSPGLLAEYLYSYVGLADLPDDSAGMGGLPEEHEDIRAHLLSFDDLMALVDSGEVQIAPLLVTIYWLAANRARLRAEAGVVAAS
ncbi:MAG: NUDIX domain-containing protein [Rhodobacteraceae bacterium]|nr:NUDIX domain-containing protein [Paracoccaceae bacterium]